jgi:hypothetical protein
MFFNPKYGKFGFITLPFNFAMLALAPMLILFATIFLLALTFFETIFSLFIWVIIGSALAVGLIFSRQLVITFFEFEFSLLKALYEIVFVRRSHDKIEKVASTRRT